MRYNWWDYENEDFGERLCMMDNREALLKLYGAGFVVAAIGFDDDHEKDFAIEMCRQYCKGRGLTQDDAKIVLKENMVLVKIK